MPEVKPLRRGYRSALRDQQAAATRQAVLGAARELFLAQGYGATTVEQIAERAGVSKPTVFSAVGSKQAVLAAVRDVALAGDDLPVAIAERAPFQAVLAEPDPYQAIMLMVGHLTDLWGRYALIREVLRGAASSGEPALRELWDLSEQQRLTAAQTFIAALARKGPLRGGLGHTPPPRSPGCTSAPAATWTWSSTGAGPRPHTSTGSPQPSPRRSCHPKSCRPRTRPHKAGTAGIARPSPRRTATTPIKNGSEPGPSRCHEQAGQIRKICARVAQTEGAYSARRNRRYGAFLTRTAAPWRSSVPGIA